MKCAIQPFLAVERIVGTDAGALTLVKPLPAKAVARRPRFTRAKRPRPQSPPDRWAAVQDHALAPSGSAGTASPTRNSIEPKITPICRGRHGDQSHYLPPGPERAVNVGPVRRRCFFSISRSL